MKRRDSSKNATSKFRRVTVGYPQGKDWDHRMDGFQGFDFDASQRYKRELLAANARNYKRASLPGELHSLNVSVTPESQLDIEWRQSDEEDSDGRDCVSVPKFSSKGQGKLVTATMSLLKPPLTTSNRPTTSHTKGTAGTKTLPTSASASLYGQYRSRTRILNMEEEELTISPCPSQSPTKHVPPSNDSIQVETTASSQSISCESSPQGTETEPTDRQRSGQWVTGLQWQSVTPEKDENNFHPNIEESTRKKKIKYQQGGLAERMQTLIAREKSAKAVWMHKIHSKVKKTQGSSKIVTVKVLSCKSHDSLLTCTCEIIPDGTNCNKSNLTVLFNQQQAKDLEISVGAVISIHPPWQQMKSSDDQDVILCTQFITVEKAGHGEQVTEPNGDSTHTVPEWCTTVTATWNCPCLTDTHVNPGLCPAQVKPYHPSVPHGCLEGSAGITLTSQSEVSLRRMEGSPQGVQQTHASSILDSIASCGGRQGLGVSFKATVQRIYKRPLASNPCWCVLVQDEFGAFSELHLTEDLLNKNKHIFYTEGKQILCKGLCVKDRINRDKHLELFNLIDSLWRPNNYLKKVDSQDSVEQDSNCAPPSFMYVLSAESGSCDLTGEKNLKLYYPADVHPMKLVLTNDGPGCSTFLTKLLYKYICHPENDGTASAVFPESVCELWLMTDLSLQPKEKSSLCSSSPSSLAYSASCMSLLMKDQIIQDLSPTSFGIGDILYLKDVRWHKGKFHPAYFTEVKKVTSTCDLKQIVTQEDLQILSVLKPSFPTFSMASPLYSVVTIQGFVEDVDEDSAFTWTECDRCGNNDLTNQQTNNLFLFCDRCQRGVEQPVTRIKLKVFLNTVSPTAKLKVELLQPTIESLLPAESDEEGYELHTVLGKPVGPLSCIVLLKTLHKDTGETHILLEEIDIIPDEFL